MAVVRSNFDSTPNSAVNEVLTKVTSDQKATQDKNAETYKWNSERFGQLMDQASIYHNEALNKQILQETKDMEKWSDNPNDPQAIRDMADAQLRIKNIISRHKANQQYATEAVALQKDNPFHNKQYSGSEVMKEASKPIDEQNFEALFERLSTTGEAIMKDDLIRATLINLSKKSENTNPIEGDTYIGTRAVKEDSIANFFDSNGEFVPLERLLAGSASILGDGGYLGQSWNAILNDELKKVGETDEEIEDYFAGFGIDAGHWIVEAYKGGRSDEKSAVIVATMMKANAQQATNRQVSSTVRNKSTTKPKVHSLFATPTDQRRAQVGVQIADQIAEVIMKKGDISSTRMYVDVIKQGMRMLYLKKDENDKWTEATKEDATNIGFERKPDAKEDKFDKFFTDDGSSGLKYHVPIALNEDNTYEQLGSVLMDQLSLAGISGLPVDSWRRRGEYMSLDSSDDDRVDISSELEELQKQLDNN